MDGCGLHGHCSQHRGFASVGFHMGCPIYQQPHCSQQLSVPKELKALLWEDPGTAGTQPRPAAGTSPPLQCRWRSQNAYLYTDTFKQMSHQRDPFPAPIWLQTVNETQ